MRHGRRGGKGGLEFGGSGEDSFVAVVVTKLTGALLFILLLTMVIMALIPRATDTPRAEVVADSLPIEITTPEMLPEAIAGRPYRVALAATGGHGPLRWAIDGTLPEGLALDPQRGMIQGTPQRTTAGPSALTLRVSDGAASASQATRLVVYRSEQPLLTGRWTPRLPAVPVRAWLDQGFGFLVLILVHLVGMNTLTGLERDRLATNEGATKARWRFAVYKSIVRVGTLLALAGLAFWLWWGRGA